MVSRARWAVAAIVAIVGCGEDAASTGGASSSSSTGSSTSASSTGAGLVTPKATGSVLPKGPIAHSGRWLVDAEGRVFLPHGVNMVQKLAPYTPASAGFSDDDAAWLESAGFRVVRVGVLATGLMPSPGKLDTNYTREIEATVKMLAGHGIYSLIDFHQDGYGPSIGDDGFPAWMTLTGSAVNNHATFPLYYINDPAIQQAFQSFWDDAKGPDGVGLQEDYAAMASELAGAFAGEPFVLGYDLFNEPWPGNTWKPCIQEAAGCPSLDENELGPFYAKALAAIRKAGDKHLVFGEPFSLFNEGGSKTSMPLPGGDANAGMAFHSYPLVPNEAPVVLKYATAWADQTGGALLNTEWGASTDSTTLTTQSTLLDEALVPWIFWSYYSETIASLDDPPAGKNLVQSTVDALVEPYPLVVAGTPEHLSIDPLAHTLSFSWSTARVGGGAITPGQMTTFEMPASAFPHGYVVDVEGGAVTSQGCAELLTIVADEGAPKTSVTIKPANHCP